MQRTPELGIPRVLSVDLTSGTIQVKLRDDLAPWLGGSGLATRLFAEEMTPGLDPLSPDQPIVFAIGPLTVAFPAITKTSAVFHSPLTGNYGECHAGGRLAMALRFAGFDAVVIRGQSRRPSYLVASSHDVRLRDATPLWGLPVEDTGRILRENEVRLGGGKRSIIRIGRAGETGVRYASVNVDSLRHFGRLGLGAVMGAKRLKAIVVGGDLSFPIADVRRYAAAYDRVHELATRSSAMQKYHELGTPQNVAPLNALGGLPTRNLEAARFEGADEISGEAFAEHNLLRKYSCFGCPVGCIHIGLLRQEFAPGYEYRHAGVSYDYELIYSLGSLLGIADRNDLLILIEAVEEAGLDAISAGVVLAWLTEALARGLVPADAVGFPLAFGDAQGYLRAIDAIVRRSGELWMTAGLGTAALAQRYGGDFDLQLSGNEISGYHTGYGTLLGHVVGARHSHLDAAGYALDQSRKYKAPTEFVDPLLDEESERCMITSLHACLFARKIYGDRELVREALGSLGIERTDAQLDDLGRSTLRLKHRIKRALGFSLEDVRLPGRFFTTPSASGVLDEAALREGIEMYRGRIEALLAEAPPETLALAGAAKARG